MYIHWAHGVGNIYRWSAIQTIISILRRFANEKKKPCAIKCTAGVHRYISTHAHSVANVNKFSSGTIPEKGKIWRKKGNNGGGGNSSGSNNGRGTKKKRNQHTTSAWAWAVCVRVLLISCRTGQDRYGVCAHEMYTQTHAHVLLYTHSIRSIRSACDC